jgi:hypothetical protein
LDKPVRKKKGSQICLLDGNFSRIPMFPVYGRHLKAGHPAFEWLAFRTLCVQVSDAKMAAILLKPFQNRTKSPVFKWSDHLKAGPKFFNF